MLLPWVYKVGGGKPAPRGSPCLQNKLIELENCSAALVETFHVYPGPELQLLELGVLETPSR